MEETAVLIERSQAGDKEAREERLDKLEKRMEELSMKKEDYWWYMDILITDEETAGQLCRV